MRKPLEQCVSRVSTYTLRLVNHIEIKSDRDKYSMVSHIHMRCVQKLLNYTTHVLSFVYLCWNKLLITYNNNNNNSLHRFFHWRFTYMQRQWRRRRRQLLAGRKQYIDTNGRDFDQKENTHAHERMAKIIIVILWVCYHVGRAHDSDYTYMFDSAYACSAGYWVQAVYSKSYGDQCWW